MGVTKTRKKVALPKPGSAKSVKKVAPVVENVQSEVVATDFVPKERPKLYRITLIEGSSLKQGRLSFDAGRPLITSDPKVYEKFCNDGHFRCEILKGGSK